MSKKLFHLTIAVVLVVLTTTNVFVYAQSAVTAPRNLQEKQELEKQLEQIEQQISQYEKELSGVKAEKDSLTKKLRQLSASKAALELKIKQTELLMADTESQINSTEQKLNDNLAQAELLKTDITGILKSIYETDQNSPVELLLGSDKFSDFFDELENKRQVSESLGAALDRIREANALLEQQKSLLDAKKEEQANLIGMVSLQSETVLANIKEHDTLLTETKGNESSYQSLLKRTREQAASIRSRIYELLGYGKQVTFGEALEIADIASNLTGVRSAFLLAVLTQESNLGKNVGTCNREGDPPEKSWKVVMKPERDQEPFLQITKELGLDPDTTPVSCPMRGKNGEQIGWGGAMGPAQFIPSTWMGYKDKVTAVTGKTANPWDIRDAFIAAGIKLKAGGAGTVDGEWAAAMRYFSGGTNTKYRFYGDNVVALAEKYQADIDALR